MEDIKPEEFNQPVDVFFQLQYLYVYVNCLLIDNVQLLTQYVRYDNSGWNGFILYAVPLCGFVCDGLRDERENIYVDPVSFGP